MRQPTLALGRCTTSTHPQVRMPPWSDAVIDELTCSTISVKCGIERPCGPIAVIFQDCVNGSFNEHNLEAAAPGADSKNFPSFTACDCYFMLPVSFLGRGKGPAPGHANPKQILRSYHINVGERDPFLVCWTYERLKNFTYFDCGRPNSVGAAHSCGWAERALCTFRQLHRARGGVCLQDGKQRPGLLPRPWTRWRCACTTQSRG